MEDDYEHKDFNICYVSTNVPGKGVDRQLFETEPCQGCRCSNDGKNCSDLSSNCFCLVASGRRSNYDISARLGLIVKNLFCCKLTIFDAEFEELRDLRNKVDWLL